MREITIKLNALPPRAINPSNDNISQVFGGCQGKGMGCSQHADCCKQMCLNSGGFGYFCYEGGSLGF